MKKTFAITRPRVFEKKHGIMTRTDSRLSEEQFVKFGKPETYRYSHRDQVFLSFRKGKETFYVLEAEVGLEYSQELEPRLSIHF